MITLVLTIYGLFIIGFGVTSFFALYQLWQFGYVGDASLRVIVVYCTVVGVILVGSLIALMAVIR